MQPTLHRLAPVVILLTAASLTASQAPAAPPTPGARQAPATPAGQQDRFPQATKSLTIGATVMGEDPVTLADVVRMFSESTGLTISVSDPDRMRLEQTSAGLMTGVTVPTGAVYSFVETMLIEHDFALTLLRSEAPMLLGLYHLPTFEGTAPYSAVLSLSEAELMAFDHPAVLVSTLLNLPHIDVRTLANSLRAVPKEKVTTVIPIGNTTTVVFRGPARSVRGLVDMVRQADRALAADPERAQRPPQAR